MTMHVGQPRHFLSVDDFSLETYDRIFAEAARIKDAWENVHEEIFPDCRNRLVSLVFAQPSTRTSSSFDKAVQTLGARVAQLNVDSSSIAKGENYDDTLSMMGLGAAALVSRHGGSAGTLRRIANEVFAQHPELKRIPIINAGEGTGEHPTQALLDMFTIQERFGQKNVRIGFYGDLKFGRTTHSLLKLAAGYGAKITCIAGDEGLEMPEKYLDYAEEKSGKRPYCTKDIDSVMADLDVLYVVRLQREYCPDKLHHVIGQEKTPYGVTPEMLKRLPATSIIMHPLPRLDELPPEIDRDPRAKYVTQAFNGIPTRMALLQYCLGGGK